MLSAPLVVAGCDGLTLAAGWALSLGAALAMFWGAVRLELPQRAARGVKAKVGRGRAR